MPPLHCLLLQLAASVHRRGRAGDPGTSTRWRREERGGASGDGVLPTGERGRLRVVGLIFVIVITATPFVAVGAVAFGRCPAPSRRHRHCLVDCRIVRAIDAMTSVSYSSQSTTPFSRPFPLPPRQSSPLSRLPCRHPPSSG